MAGKYPVRVFKCSNEEYPRSLMAEWLEAVKKETSPPEMIFGETDIEGVRLDFNFGLRLQIPALGDDTLHVVIGNAESGEVYFDEEVSRVVLVSFEKYFLPWQVDIFYHGTQIFSHTFNPEGQEVFFKFPKTTIGDTIALLPYVDDFAKRWGCSARVLVPESLREIAERSYPKLFFTDSMDKSTYATYYMNVWMDIYMPGAAHDGRMTPMEQMGRAILGTPYTVCTAKFRPNKPRTIREPYVCIGVQASSPWKGWHYPGGWDAVVDYLKGAGYRVICIDRDYEVFDKELIMKIPEGAEDFTGNIPLTERINLLAYAEFFIGLGSGLSWLAYAAGCPVVMIVGFTLPWFEFDTPYRVQNYLTCYGCFNDVRVDYKDVKNCPYHKNTDSQYECSRLITSDQVISTLERLRRDLSRKGEFSQE